MKALGVVLAIGLAALVLTMVALSVNNGDTTETVTIATAVRSESVQMVTLICVDCANAGISINVWQRAGQNRGRVVFSLPHLTSVRLNSSKIADDGRRWYEVGFQDKTGWVAEDFVRR